MLDFTRMGAVRSLVESPHDAIVAYLNSGLDVLVMDAFYVDKKSSDQASNLT